MVDAEEKISREILNFLIEMGTPLTVDEIADAFTYDRTAILNGLLSLMHNEAMISERVDGQCFFWAQT